MIIDGHVHIFPDSVAPKAIANLERHAPRPLATDGTLGGLLASMKKSDIAMSIVLPVSTKPEQVPSINSYAIKLNRNTIFSNGDGVPSPRFSRPGVRPSPIKKEPFHPSIIAFGTLHPDFAEYRDEIARLKDSGLKGVKMHPDYQAFDADEKRLFPLYECLAKAGLILYLHSGENINFDEPPRCSPARLANIIKSLPELKLIAAHLGGWSMWDEVERWLVGTPIFLDTSFTLGYIGEEQFLRIIRAHGMEKIIFGSDSPWNDPGQAAREISGQPLEKSEIESILGGNAARLLSLPAI